MVPIKAILDTATFDELMDIFREQYSWAASDHIKEVHDAEVRQAFEGFLRKMDGEFDNYTDLSIRAIEKHQLEQQRKMLRDRIVEGKQHGYEKVVLPRGVAKALADTAPSATPDNITSWLIYLLGGPKPEFAQRSGNTDDNANPATEAQKTPSGGPTGAITGHMRGCIADMNKNEISDHLVVGIDNHDWDWLDAWRKAVTRDMDEMDAVYQNLCDENERLSDELVAAKTGDAELIASMLRGLKREGGTIACVVNELKAVRAARDHWKAAFDKAKKNALDGEMLLDLLRDAAVEFASVSACKRVIAKDLGDAIGVVNESMRLPMGADGEPICLGERVMYTPDRTGVVDAIRYERGSCHISVGNGFWYLPMELRHVKGDANA